MKQILILLITLSACQVKKETTNTDITRLHDIWALSSIDGKEYTPEQSQKHPTLEIYVAEKRVAGNDGCNGIFGGIETLSSNELKFGMLAGTKMMCQKMEVADAFGAALGQVAFYELKELKLSLLDQDRNELMVLKKVD